MALIAFIPALREILIIWASSIYLFSDTHKLSLTSLLNYHPDATLGFPLHDAQHHGFLHRNASGSLSAISIHVQEDCTTPSWSALGVVLDFLGVVVCRSLIERLTLVALRLPLHCVVVLLGFSIDPHMIFGYTGNSNF